MKYSHYVFVHRETTHQWCSYRLYSARWLTRLARSLLRGFTRPAVNDGRPLKTRGIEVQANEGAYALLYRDKVIGKILSVEVNDNE